ncbi:MAG: RNA polymerase sigma factor [Bryobacteraceae bacterium]|nr:RNA polymerase sigma factor [Bryobacteraceae bacterium]
MQPDIESLFRQYSADVYRFALYLSGDPHDAEDITSETFVRVWTAPEQIRVATVKGYLFTIARNLYLQGLRRSGRRTAELDEALPDNKPGPLHQTEARAELDAVLADLQRLPEIDRTALLMRARDQVPYEDIAQALGISVASAKVKVHRARLLLQKQRNAHESHA